MWHRDIPAGGEFAWPHGRLAEGGRGWPISTPLDSRGRVAAGASRNVGTHTGGLFMQMRQLVHAIVGLLVFVKYADVRDERGLSQSAENAILLAGAVTVAGIVIAAITVYVRKHMPK